VIDGIFSPEDAGVASKKIPNTHGCSKLLPFLITIMKLKNLQKHWDAWAKKDAMWAILTEPLLANNAWDSATFFETGREDIRQAFAELDKRHITLRHNSALDFGCGIGRLTQALAPFFKNTHGVDISSSMIEQADKHNQFKNSCFYHVNCEDNLKMFRDNEFDFIYSHIALQHTSSASQISYLKEFARYCRTNSSSFRDGTTLTSS
jgi:2-polyprenyl-3-methyl-5-hydroxy-6-metoxy-1,4-benzoquinol methylase